MSHTLVWHEAGRYARRTTDHHPLTLDLTTQVAAHRTDPAHYGVVSRQPTESVAAGLVYFRQKDRLSQGVNAHDAL